MEPRKPETRLQGRVGNDAIAEYSTGSSYARACKVIGREARRCGACPWRRKGPPGEMAGSERSNSATADARAADKTRTPPRPAKPLAPTPTCPPNPPPLPPPPPGPASATPVIGGIVRSMIAAVAMPLIKRALAGVAILSVAAHVGARRGGPAHQRPRQWCCARARQPRHRVQPATLAVQ